VSRVAQAGAVPLVMGGDGMINLPQMRALHRLYPDLCALHLDAHTDAYPNDGPGRSRSAMVPWRLEHRAQPTTEARRIDTSSEPLSAPRFSNLTVVLGCWGVNLGAKNHQHHTRRLGVATRVPSPTYPAFEPVETEGKVLALQGT
jgi:hypothetical protein